MANERLLVIEDNLLNLELMTDLLEASGYQVLTATTAEAGLDAARCELPALIMMDVSLPGMDGLTAIAALRADPLTAGIPIIVVTAHAMKGDEQQALSAGGDRYLSKPLDTQAFRTAVAEMLARRAQD